MCLVLSGVQLFVTPWAVTCQAPLSIGFSRQEMELVTISLSRGSSPPRDQTRVSSVFCVPAEPSGKPKQIKAHLFESEGGHIALNHNSVIDTDDR